MNEAKVLRMILCEISRRMGVENIDMDSPIEVLMEIPMNLKQVVTIDEARAQAESCSVRDVLNNAIYDSRLRQYQMLLSQKQLVDSGNCTATYVDSFRGQLSNFINSIGNI